MKNIFLTGGNGFLGKNISTAFSQRYFIDAPNHSLLDLVDSKRVNCYLREKNYDCVIHAASVNTSKNNQKSDLVALNENTRAFVNILNNDNKFNRFIFLSSGAAYSLPLSVKKIDESFLGKNIPEDGYGFSKFICSRMLESKLPEKAVSLHFFGIFGQHEDHQAKFISNSIYNALNNQPIIVNNPKVEFDYLYSKDCAHIIEKFVNNKAIYHHYNIASGHPMTLLEVAEIIIEVVGRKSILKINSDGANISYTANNQRLREFLGSDFKFTPFKTAIEELVSWFDQLLAALAI